MCDVIPPGVIQMFVFLYPACIVSVSRLYLTRQDIAELHPGIQRGWDVTGIQNTEGRDTVRLQRKGIRR